MSFFKKIFKKKPEKQNDVEQKAESKTLESNENLIQIYDEYGREIFIDKDEWRKNVLPGTIKENWDKPDELYGVILGALNDNFYEDVFEASKRLHEIDPIPTRSACILGIVLMKKGDLDGAEEVFRNHISTHGEEGVILTNLAKVQAERGDHDTAEKTLWHALEIDPNQDNAVGWFAAIYEERDGEEGYSKALEKIASIEGSWRAKIWLAKIALDGKDHEKAFDYYDTVLEMLENIPPEVMMQISGDLGNAGKLQEMVDILGPRFDTELHGLMGGNNLIKAYLELGDLESARTIVGELFSMNRPDWKKHLQYWDDEINKLSKGYGESGGEPELSITTLTLGWPVWSHKLSSMEKILPVKRLESPMIGFISSSCEYEEMPEVNVPQKTDREGTLSRAIPLYLAERLFMDMNARTVMFVPVVAGQGSFVFSRTPWEDEMLVNMAEDSDAGFLFAGHLIAKGEEWEYQGKLVDSVQKKVIDRFSVSISSDNPGEDVLNLSEEFLDMIYKHCILTDEESPIEYRIPQPEYINLYLDAISQSLALTVATVFESGAALYGERSILDNLLDLALNAAENNVARLMFLSALAKNKAYGSNIYLDYKTKAEKLSSDYPLTGVAGEVWDETFKSLYQTAIE